MNAGADNLLEVRDVSVRYGDGVRALRGVTLAVGRSRRVGLIGPNGSGKTTLLLAVMGGVAFDGSIRIDSAAVSSGSRDAARQRCGMTFQDAEDQLFMPTLLEDVAFGPLNQGRSPADARDRSEAVMAAVGLPGLGDRSAHHLSGGQKRLAALATVLSMQVDLLLLDEPGANLDARSRRRLGDVLCDRSEAMLLATHDLDMVATVCADVILLDEGRVVAAGPCGEILDDAALLAQHGLA